MKMKSRSDQSLWPAFVLVALSGICVHAQGITGITASARMASAESSAPALQAALLPDAPAAFDLRGANEPHKAGPAATNGLGSVTAEASHTQKYIEPGQTAPSLSAGDKVLLGVRDAFSLFSAASWVASAGYEHLVNGSPNYGTDRGALGERLGAAAVRDISEGVICDSVLSPVLHEDPRYYRLGPSHNFLVRAVYAATRPIITRTDGGRMSPNLALIGGNAGGSALTNLYYPQLNRGFTQTAETFGGSIGGSALGDLVSEFYDDVIHPHRNR